MRKKRFVSLCILSLGVFIFIACSAKISDKEKIRKYCKTVYTASLNLNIQNCILKKSIPFKAIHFAKNTKLLICKKPFYVMSCTLVKDTLIQKHLIFKNSKVVFYPSSVLKKVYAAKNLKIKNKYYQKNKPLSFYKNGQVKSGFLISDFRFKNLMIKKARLSFYESGAFKEGFLSQKASIKSMKIIPLSLLTQSRNNLKFQIQFYPNGALKKVFSDKNIRFKNFVFSGIYGVEFYQNGNLKSGILKRNVKIKGIEYQANYLDCLKFYKNGQVKSARIAQKLNMQNYQLQKGDFVQFDKNAQLKAGN